jgi:hypothetical protein
VLREKCCWLVADGWFILREKYCWLVADKPNEQGVKFAKWHQSHSSKLLYILRTPIKRKEKKKL